MDTDANETPFLKQRMTTMNNKGKGKGHLSQVLYVKPFQLVTQILLKCISNFMKQFNSSNITKNWNTRARIWFF